MVCGAFMDYPHVIIIYLALLMCRLCFAPFNGWDTYIFTFSSRIFQVNHESDEFFFLLLEPCPSNPELLKVKENNLFLVDIQGRIET